jgi:hypothetical protein
MNFTRRKLMIGLAAVAAVGPAIAKAAVARPAYASGGYVTNFDGYCLATLRIDGKQHGAAQKCSAYFKTKGENIILHIDSPLHFGVNRSGTGVVRFTNAHNPNLWVQIPLESPANMGDRVMIA